MQQASTASPPSPPLTTQCQGATLKGRTIVDIDEAFAPGLMYVVMSRVCQRSQLRVVGGLQAHMFVPIDIDRLIRTARYRERMADAARATAHKRRYGEACPTAPDPRRAEAPILEADGSMDRCAICSDHGTLLCCDHLAPDGTACPRAYHPQCVGLEAVPEGAWICPVHATKSRAVVQPRAAAPAAARRPPGQKAGVPRAPPPSPLGLGVPSASPAALPASPPAPLAPAPTERTPTSEARGHPPRPRPRGPRAPRARSRRRRRAAAVRAAAMRPWRTGSMHATTAGTTRSGLSTPTPAPSC